MNRFEKRNTTREIEVFGDTYNVDFGRDEIPFIFQEVPEELKGVGGKKADQVAILEKQKAIFKTAINKIIGDSTAADLIFREDNSAILHSDIYTFLVNQYTEVMTEESLYSPKRVK